MIDTILIDLDNTIIDSNYLHEESFNQVFYENNLTIKWDYSDYQGYSTLEILTTLIGHENDLESMSVRKTEIYTGKIDEGKLNFLPHAKEFIEFIQRVNCRLFLTTAASKSSVDRVQKLISLSGAFQDVILVSEIGFPKTNPNFWKRITNERNFELESCLVIDDVESVLIAAKNANYLHLAHTQNTNLVKPVFLNGINYVNHLMEIIPLLRFKGKR
jgi:HAD superfamily hydrolase (TIGR01509 family)